MLGGLTQVPDNKQTFRQEKLRWYTGKSVTVYLLVSLACAHRRLCADPGFFLTCFSEHMGFCKER